MLDLSFAPHSVNAADFGFLPENSADENSAALQAIVNRGGDIVVDAPGVYDLSETIRLGDDVSLRFGAGVYVRRALAADSTQHQGYVFVNRGAYERTYNKNISITGLHLIANGMEPSYENQTESDMVTGLRAHLAFFYVRNLTIRDFELLDLGRCAFGIQICTFENAILENIHIEGGKDAVHFGKGSKFVVRHGLFRTFDDPIALNAHDYATSNPQMGWIENGVIEDCYDLDQESTTGFFCRILAGSWGDWQEGMVVRHSDSVVSDGRVYRVCMKPDGASYISRTRPTHTDGAAELDGITWVMVQDDDPIYNCGCRNIHFKDIFLEKKRPVAFSVHFDNDKWSHSYYPDSEAPVQKDLIFENIFFLADVPVLITANAPVNAIKLINSVVENSRVNLAHIDLPGLDYGKTHILISGCTLRAHGETELVTAEPGRAATLKVLGSIVENDVMSAVVRGDVRVISSDIPVKSE